MNNPYGTVRFKREKSCVNHSVNLEDFSFTFFSSVFFFLIISKRRKNYKGLERQTKAGEVKYLHFKILRIALWAHVLSILMENKLSLVKLDLLFPGLLNQPKKKQLVLYLLLGYRFKNYFHFLQNSYSLLWLLTIFSLWLNLNSQ